MFWENLFKMAAFCIATGGVSCGIMYMKYQWRIVTQLLTLVVLSGLLVVVLGYLFGAIGITATTIGVTLAVVAFLIIPTVMLGARRITGGIGQLNSFLEDISQSGADLDRRLEVNGNDEITEISKSCNRMIQSLSEKDKRETRNKEMIDEVIGALSKSAQGLRQGRLASRADAPRATGMYADVLDQFNGAVQSLVDPLNLSTEYMSRIGRGDIPEKIVESFQGDFEKIKTSTNLCIDALNTLQEDLLTTIEAQKNGDIDARCKPEKLQGGYAVLAEGVNETIEAIVRPVVEGIGIMQKYAAGDLSAQMRKLPGKQIVLTEGLNAIRNNVGMLVEDVNGLAQAAVNGELSTRADASRHKGDYQNIVHGINNTLDAVLQPISEASAVLEKLADYDLRERVKGNYRGEHAKIKDSVNRTAEALHGAMLKVAEAVEQVTFASNQIASSSQQVAEGTSEQASSLEETSSSLEEMASMTKQNSESTSQAKALAESTRSAAGDGARAMGEMVSSMTKIKGAAEGTAAIIKDINEIAFQTNLLALNAAVEAARAGDAGRGFAVVAEEVRNLAGRAKDAAKNTEVLIKESVSLAEEGEQISSKVNGNLSNIVESVGKVTDIVSEITVASQEQARGIEQVNRAVAEMDKVVQQSAANAEESSSSAEELSSQARELAAMVSRFELGQKMSFQQPHRKASPHVPALPGKTKRGNGASQPFVNPRDLIPLDDDSDFAEF